MTARRLFESLAVRLLAHPRLGALREVARGVPTYLVGGSLRDLTLGCSLSDLDFVLARDGERIAGALASRLGLRATRLGGERFRAWRIVVEGVCIDLWDLDGTSLEKDLWRRDLTVNALALDIESGELIDPTGGRADLDARLLRMTRSEVFAEDPVRSLRLARLALGLPGFSAEPATVDAARRASPRLTEAPFERVRGELDRILAATPFRQVVRWLVDLELLPALLGATGASLAQAMAAGVEAIDRLDVTSPTKVNTAGMLDELALHWAFLAALRSSNSTAESDLLPLAARRRLITRETRTRADALLAATWEPPPTPIARRLWLHDAGTSWQDAWRLRAALAVTVQDRDSWLRAGHSLLRIPDHERRMILAPPRFLDGVAVREILALEPGPAVGAALARLERAQVEGMVNTKEEALAFLQRIR